MYKVELQISKLESQTDQFNQVIQLIEAFFAIDFFNPIKLNTRFASNQDLHKKFSENGNIYNKLRTTYDNALEGHQNNVAKMTHELDMSLEASSILLRKDHNAWLRKNGESPFYNEAELMEDTRKFETKRKDILEQANQLYKVAIAELYPVVNLFITNYANCMMLPCSSQ